MMNDDEIDITDKERDIIKQILALEKYNNKIDRFNNQEMVTRIIEIIKKGVSDEV